MRNSFVIALLLATSSAIRLQKKDIEGHTDMAFQPNPIYPNTLHADRLTKIPAVKRGEHIGDSVWRSSVDGGEPNPEPRRDMTGHMNSMFNYPVKQTPDPHAEPPSNGIPTAVEAPSVAVPKEKIEAAKAQRAKEAEAERKEEAAAAKGSLAQKKAVDIEGHSDMAFQPNPIYPNTLHADRLTKIPAVKRDDHIGDSVWRSSVDGGEPNPEQRRDMTGHMNSMFNYPTKQTPDPNADPKDHGIPAPEAPSVAVTKEQIEASKAARAKEAAAEAKEEKAAADAAKDAKPAELDPAKASLAQKKDSSDPAFQPHPILPDAVHAHHIKQIPPVSRNEHIGDSVWRSSVDGGEPIPEPRRNLQNQHSFKYDGHTPAPAGAK